VVKKVAKKAVKKLNKSAQVRELLMQDWRSADAIAKQVDCSKALVHQVNRKMRKESDKKVEDAYAEKTNIAELLAQAKPFPIEPPLFKRIEQTEEKMLDDMATPLYTVISDPINPYHYKRNGIEAVDVIEAFDLNYRLGNVVKYVLRHVGKNGLEDLKKARWYLDREISKYEV
jgi:cytochrome c551/c552